MLAFVGVVLTLGVGRSVSQVSIGGTDAAILERTLLVPGMQWLEQGQQLRAVEAARLASPSAVAARLASRTAFENLGATAVARLAVRAFPATMDEPAAGLPRLPRGQRIVRLAGSNVAEVDLGGKYKGVVESSAPMGHRSRDGSWIPIDLALRHARGGFVPMSSAVETRIPDKLSLGVGLPSVGVSIIPVSNTSTALAGATGVLTGSAVLYANTQLDTDTVVKPSQSGVSVDALLLSVRSPQQLRYKLGLPVGGRLVPTQGSAGVRIIKSGSIVAAVPAPIARDANGTVVPVQMSVAGSTIVLTVDHTSGSYEYPIEVDPELTTSIEYGWRFEAGKKDELLHIAGEGSLSHEKETPARWTSTYPPTWLPEGTEAYDVWTQGNTKLYELTGEIVSAHATEALSPPVYVELAEGKGTFPEVEIPEGHQTQSASVRLCANEACSPENVHNGGGAYFGTDVVGPEITLEGGCHCELDAWFNSYDAYIAEEKGEHTTIAFNTSAPTIAKASGTTNVLYGDGAWMGPNSGALEFTAKDLGLGVSETEIEYYGPHGWEPLKVPEPGWNGSSNETWCQSKPTWKCAPERPEAEDYTTLNVGPRRGVKGPEPLRLPEGEDRIRVAAHSAMPETWSREYGEGETVVKIDYTKPRNLSVTPLQGVTARGTSGGEFEMDEVPVSFKGEATDGTKPTKSSGIASLTLSVDGREVAKAGGSCTPGECTASEEFLVNGQELGGGRHTLTLTATDYAGNIESKSYTLIVRQASPLALGPGSVNPISGDYTLNATDVSLGSGLSVTRHYDSRNLTAGKNGPLGPQWSLSLGSLASLEVLPDGSVLLAGAEGVAYFAAESGGYFKSPAGDSNLTLRAWLNAQNEVTEYLLKDPAKGTKTRFTLPSGAKTWMPTVSEGPVATGEMTDSYTTIVGESGEAIVEPTLELEPHPEATCGAKKLDSGCRALTFKYAEHTAATESESGWGEYAGRLMAVSFSAYNPSTAKVESKPVAEYLYDSRGRLRAEIDPRTSLRTTYGYDSEGHVTAVNEPGVEPWLLHYGTIPSDASAGRLLSVIRPGAEQALGRAELPTVASPPKLSTAKPAEGKEISISSNGTWSGGTPLSYAYQWEECSDEGSECQTIPGATNQSYYPTEAVVGRELSATVTALGAGGAAVAGVEHKTSAVVSGKAKSPAPAPPAVGTSAVWTIDYQVPLSGAEPTPMTKAEVEKGGQTDDPKEGATAVFPPDEPMGWPAENYNRATVYYFDEEGRTVNVATPAGGISTTEYNKYNEVTRTLSPANRVAALERGSKSAEASRLLDTKNVYNESAGEAEPATRLLESIGPEHKVRLADGEEVLARNRTNYYYDEGAPGGEAYDLVTKLTDGAEYAGKEVEERTTTTAYSGQDNLGWTLRKPTSETEYLAGRKGVREIKRETLYNETTGAVTETSQPKGVAGSMSLAREVGSTGTGNGQFVRPDGLAIDAHEDIWVADYDNDRVQELSKTGAYEKQLGAPGAGAGELNRPTAVVVDYEGNIWVTDAGNERIDEFSPEGTFIEAVGWGVADGKPKEETCTTATGCRVGIAGIGEGQFDVPQAITRNNRGRIWVVSQETSRVAEFTEAGEFVRTIAGAGESGIAWSNGDLWLDSGDSGTVRELTENGELVTTFGSEGEGPGEFEEASNIAVDSEGNIWIADSESDRMQEFNSKGGYLSEIRTEHNGAFAVAVDPHGDVWIRCISTRAARTSHSLRQPGTATSRSTPLRSSMLQSSRASGWFSP
jgi:sugar lactone lactonase YvrE